MCNRLTRQIIQNGYRKQHSTTKPEANHRSIGTQQVLWQFSPFSPGSPIFLPHGLRIVNRLVDWFTMKYRQMDYQLVVTPTIYNKALWEKSGHWQMYKNDMFSLTSQPHNPIPEPHKSVAEQHNHVHNHTSNHTHPVDLEQEGEFAIKPMNCPGHCLIFASTIHSFRDLPLRIAEFSPLHRNEASGALTGLTRTRKFHQDDAHIFCAKEDIQNEIAETLKLVDEFYSILGLPYSIVLSTRPDEYLGSLEDWNHAEDALKSALDHNGKRYEINAGDGAFYGPKIDIHIHTSTKRHQTATIQLDFQLPIRFNLHFVGESGEKEVPVILHRAIMGSIERSIAILAEHFQGKWPTWMSPRQAIVIPSYVKKDSELESYANYVKWVLSSPHRMRSFEEFNENKREKMRVNARFHYVDVNMKDDTLSRKIVDATELAYNYILVVGDREVQKGTVTVRKRGERKGVEMTLSEFVQVLQLDEDDYR
jgi:threonyl-tRNA synthetase